MRVYQHYDASLLLIGIKLKPQFCVLAVVITTALLSAHKKGFWDRVTSKGPMINYYSLIVSERPLATFQVRPVVE